MAKSAIEIVELVMLCLIACLVLLGNILVILAFKLGPRSIRTFTNYFVVNLAVSDLTVGCLSLPFWILNRADSLLIRQNIYSFFIALDILCGTCSILNLAAISLERMFAVKFPTKHFNLKKLPVMCVIVGTWVYSISLVALKFITNVRVFTATIFVLAFLTPLILIVVCYFVIFKTAVRMMEASNQPGKLARELRVAKTISVIISLFVFCWMPFFVTNMVYIFCTGSCSNLPRWVIYLTKMIHYSNSMMNFFVYAVRSPDFRRSFQAILFKCDTTSLRERIRTFSESVIPRSRTASERQSFLADHLSPANHCQKNGVKKHDLNLKAKPQTRAKSRSQTSYMSNGSDHSDFTMLNGSSNGSVFPGSQLMSIGELFEEAVTAEKNAIDENSSSKRTSSF